MNELQKIASDLLDTDQVQLVIGYEAASGNSVRAAFIRNSKDSEKLIFNSHCIQNLAVYITKKEFKSFNGIALIASLPVMRSVLQLARENQLTEKVLKVIGVSSDGKRSAQGLERSSH